MKLFDKPVYLIYVTAAGGSIPMKTSREALIENLVTENYEKYYRLAFSYVHNEADALDIVQEGAYKAMFKCDSLKEDNFAATWVYRIMLNEIFLFCRRKETS